MKSVSRMIRSDQVAAPVSPVLLDERLLEAARRLREFLRQLGEELIAASYYCPDAPGVPSTRRKPEPGMVLEAAAPARARCWC